MKIVALTAFHQRPEISRIFWQNCKDIGLDVVAIVSDEQNKQMAKENALAVFEYKNNPLGEKLQRGVEYVRDNVDFDYLLFLGSDDLISHNLLDIYKKYIEKYKYVGVQDYLDMDFRTKKFRYFQGYTNWRRGESLGAGRLISKEYLELIDYKCFPMDRHKGMDGVMTNNLASNGIFNKLIKKGNKPYLIGIKHPQSYSYIIKNTPYNQIIDLTGYFSQEVIKMLYK